MSAVLFPMDKPTVSNSAAAVVAVPGNREQSRIPVPSSPLLRRTFRGDSHVSNSFSRVANRTVCDGPLRRGYSFMERGERRHQRHGAAAVPRPQHLDTEPRRPRTVTVLTPQSPARIRSLSLSLSNTRLGSPRSPSAVTSSPRTPPASPNARHLPSTLDWDTESIASLTSITSVGSCDHASIARNGTTFSGRSMKYVFHCNQHAGQTGEDYLTPTQRVHRQVKKLKYLLQQAKKDLEDKDSDILKLTKEVVELRLYKAALNSPEDKSNSSDTVTVKENNADDEQVITTGIDGNRSVQLGEMNSSYTDSGHFDDFTGSSVHSKDSSTQEEGGRSPYRHKFTAEKAVGTSFEDSMEHNKLIQEYEKRLQELVKTHEDDSYQLKQKHNDKIEELLQRITEINTRYWQLVPELDLAKEKIKELESQLEDACKKLEQQEEKQKQTFLTMYNKGQEAARLEQEKKVMEIASQGPSRISVPELLQELQVTKNELENIKDLEYASTSNNLQPLLSAKEALSLWVLGARKAMYRQLMEAKNKNKIDPEITLQFLKSAIYYFLTDKENSQGHLRAIQSILGFTPNEISNIDKARFA